jgi:hypothetical protein
MGEIMVWAAPGAFGLTPLILERGQGVERTGDNSRKADKET